MQPKGNFIQVPVSQPPHPFPPFPVYLVTLPPISPFPPLSRHSTTRVLIELEYLQPIDVRHRDLVAQDMQGVENTHCLHLIQLNPFLAFDCLFNFFLSSLPEPSLSLLR
jgi:hypothetical protein